MVSRPSSIVRSKGDMLTDHIEHDRVKSSYAILIS